MPTTDQAIQEILNLVSDGQQDQSVLEARRTEVAGLIAQSNTILEGLPRAARQTRTEQRRQLEAQEAAQFRQATAGARIRQRADSYELEGDQEFLARQNGTLGAALNQSLQQDINRRQQAILRSGESPAEDEELQQLLVDQQVFRQNEAAFFQQQGRLQTGPNGEPVLPFDPAYQNPDGEVSNIQRPEFQQELNSDNGFIRNVLGSAVGGLVGLAGTVTSALGAEETGAAIAGLGADLNESIGSRDLASRAASAELGDIVARAQGGELSIPDAIAQAARVATVGGGFTGLVEGTAGAAVGGGGLGAAGRVAGGAARALGAGGAASAVGRTAGAVAPQGTGAALVGLGAGVDENLTSDQARILLGTGVASGQVGRFAGTAETGLAALGRSVANPLTGGRVARAAPTTGAQGALSGAGRGAASTAVGETAQEFIEGAGESFGTSAQQAGTGVLETLADPDAQQAALTGGAVSAPLGAVVGAPIGGVTGAAGGRANAQAQVAAEQQAAQQQAAALRAQQEQTGQVQADAIEAQADIQDAVNTQRGFIQQQAIDENAFRDSVITQQDALNQRATQRANVTTPFDPNLPIGQRGQLQPQVATFESEFINDPQGDNLAEFAALEPQAQEATLRALFRNDPDTQQAGEDAFIQAVGPVDNTITQQGFFDRLGQAFNISNQPVDLQTPLDQAAGQAATDAIDAGTPLAPQTGGTANIDALPPGATAPDPQGTVPGEAEAVERAARVETAAATFDRISQQLPRNAQPSDPTVLSAVDLNDQGQLDQPFDLNIDPLQIQSDISTTATLENTLLAEPTEVTQTQAGPQPRAIAAFLNLASLDPEAQVDALEGLAVRSGLTPEQATAFALEVGPPQGTVEQYRAVIASALANQQNGQAPAQAAPETPPATPAPADPPPVDIDSLPPAPDELIDTPAATPEELFSALDASVQNTRSEINSSAETVFEPAEARDRLTVRPEVLRFIETVLADDNTVERGSAAFRRAFNSIQRVYQTLSTNQNAPINRNAAALFLRNIHVIERERQAAGK